MHDIDCEFQPVLWGPFLYYHDMRMERIIQIDRRDGTRRTVCSQVKGTDVLTAIGSLLYCPYRGGRWQGNWTTMIDMQVGTLRQINGIPVGLDKDRYFTLRDDNILQAYNTKGELEQTYVEGLQQELQLIRGASVASFNQCTVFTFKTVEDLFQPHVYYSTYIWNSKTGKLIATFPFLFLREDQGKLYFLDPSASQLIIFDFTQSDPIQV